MRVNVGKKLGLSFGAVFVVVTISNAISWHHLSDLSTAQKDLFGEIALERHERFDAVFASGQPQAAIESVEKDYR